MANQTSRTRPGRIIHEMLINSVDTIVEYLHEELYHFEEDEEIPEDHVAFYVARLVHWRNQESTKETLKAYNGWKNYETWLTALWITSDIETTNYWLHRTKTIWDKLRD